MQASTCVISHIIMYFSPTLPKAKHDLFQTLLPALFLFLLLCSFIFQSLIWPATVTAWMKNLSGKDAVVNLFSNSTVFAFPRCDCGISRWIGRPDCPSTSFSSSTESEQHKDPASLVNLSLLLFNGKRLVVGFTWGPLWSVMDLRKC